MVFLALGPAGWAVWRGASCQRRRRRGRLVGPGSGHLQDSRQGGCQDCGQSQRAGEDCGAATGRDSVLGRWGLSQRGPSGAGTSSAVIYVVQHVPTVTSGRVSRTSGFLRIKLLFIYIYSSVLKKSSNINFVIVICPPRPPKKRKKKKRKFGIEFNWYLLKDLAHEIDLTGKGTFLFKKFCATFIIFFFLSKRHCFACIMFLSFFKCSQFLSRSEIVLLKSVGQFCHLCAVLWSRSNLDRLRITKYF